MTDPISRLNTALSGRYQIERELGEGGMATVYLARDLKHNRHVALKVLKPELAAVVGGERFLAEIETTANLQHPHILPLFDSGEADGFLFYVMPYVEGETLREKLGREHQLPVDEAVRIATAMAEALDYAHRHGVVHRDIKPANVLIHEGQPVISDFGIALAVGVAGGGRLTETGLSLGTPHYMSPEQATGDVSVGPATDVYALGAVLYEMLVGEPPYTGTTAQAILGRIIAAERVSATKHRASVPAHVESVIRKALEKLPADRFTSAHDFAGALGDTGFRYGEAAVVAAAAGRPRWQAAGLVGVGLLLGLGAMAMWSATGQGGAPAADVVRFTVTPPEGSPLDLAGNAQHLAISHDGSRIVYQSGNGAADLRFNVRPIDQLESVPLRGSEGAAAPFFSPDGEWVGFIPSSNGVLLKVSTYGGPPVTLAEPSLPMIGWSWGADDRIVFGTVGGGLFAVPGGGGEPEQLTTPDTDEGETDHVGPFVVDGEDLVLFVANHGQSPLITGELAVLDLSDGEITRLDLPGVSPRYVSTGHIVYAAGDGSVRAVPFDVGSRRVTGSPVPILEGVRVTANGAADFAISDDGTLLYAVGSGGGTATPTNLVVVRPDGSRSLLAELVGIGWFPRFSPDGSRIAYAVASEAGNGGEADLWVVDALRGAQTRVTFGGNNRFYPLWEPDGTRLTHADGSANQNRLLSTPADGSGGDEVLLDVGDRRFPTSWSPDGSTLAYYVGPAGTPTNSRDLWMLELDGAQAASEPFVETPFMERGAIFSPDGHWLAYVSDKAGQNDVYARPFPGPGTEITISVGGGQEPVWDPSGAQLYYRRAGELVAVSVDLSSPSLSVGAPRRVMADAFRRDTGGALGGMANYDIAPDGESFVMVEDRGASDGELAQPQLYVVVNWFEELRERVPTE